jgi:uncharacterized membrane protein YphA (DoxX/SURF4 family)
VAGLDRRRLSDQGGSRALSLLANRWLQLFLRVALGGYFLYASLDKIANPAAFARVVYQWQVVGPIPSNLVAILLPWVEAIAGVLLVAGLWKRESAAVIALLLVVFLGAATSVLARGIDVDNCGCTSVEAVDKTERSFFEGVGTFLILRNLVMLGAAAVLIAVPPREGR